MEKYNIIEEYKRFINEKVKKIDIEYSECEDLVYIKCETLNITLGGVHFNEIVELSNLKRKGIKRFWDDIIGNEIKTIKWWKYKNTKNKCVSINNKEFIINETDNYWYISCDICESDAESDIESDEVIM